MSRYLIDVNLPYYFSLWEGDEYIHQKDINDEWSDSQIWEYAKNNNLIIISKDADFSKRIFLSIPPPKVIHIKFGNKKMKEFYSILSMNWGKAKELIELNKLVNIYEDRIEAIV